MSQRRHLRTACLLFLTFVAWIGPGVFDGPAIFGSPGIFGSKCQAQDASGVWRGRWTADATARRPEHGGALRVRLRHVSGNTYQGTFSGRFAVVLPYFYRAPVYQSGNTLYSTKKLGPLGSYNMTVHQSPSTLNGRWNAGQHTGSIRLQRR